jgi:hypothetical protein
LIPITLRTGENLLKKRRKAVLGKVREGMEILVHGGKFSRINLAQEE